MGPARAPFSFHGDALLFVYLLALARFCTALAALDTGSAFEGMGAAREVSYAVLSEAALVTALVVLAVQSGSLQLAMSYGKPVVVTAVGGFPEFLGEGEGGLVVPANDHASMAKALITLLSDPDTRERMGQYNHERAKTDLSWSRIASLTMEAYRQILNKSKAPKKAVINESIS